MNLKKQNTKWEGGGDRVVTKIFVFMFSENPNLILLNFRDNATKMFKYWRYIFGENFVFFVKIFVVFNPSNGQNPAAKYVEVLPYFTDIWLEL